MASPPQVKPRVKINSAQYFRPKPPSLWIGNEISRGAYGSVHSGELDGRPVAVKRIHLLLLQAARSQGNFDQVMADFKRECQLLERIDHPHVVDFRGAFYDQTTDGPVLVMEKMQKNLLQFLERSGNDLSPQKKLEICLAIARGLRFLHTHTPPIVHRDLTDKNVLLGKDGLVKIGDLGQSRLKANNAEYFTSAQPGAIPFMPPEAMQEHSRYNEKLDVFSLGVLMLEIATQQPPCVKLVGIGTKKEVDRRRVDLAKLKEGHCLKPLILSCLKDDPQERPDIASIHDQLLAMVEGMETKADGLREQITALQLALQEAREENSARTEHEAKLTSQFQADIAQCDATIQQLVVKCEQMEAQATTYKLDFDQERSDRQEAAGKFDEERQTWQKDILALNEKQEKLLFERDEIYAQLEQLKEASAGHKRELKEKDEMLRHANSSYTDLEQKLFSLQLKHDEVTKENASMKSRLQNKDKDFTALKTVEDAEYYMNLYHDAESKRSAAASRITELTLVVNALEEKSHGSAGGSAEALREEVQRMKQNYDALEASFQRVTSEKQQLAFDYRDLQAVNAKLQTDIKMLKSGFAMTGGPEGGPSCSVQVAIGSAGDQHNAVQPVVFGQPRAKQPMEGNGARGDFHVAQFAGDFMERNSPPGSLNVGKGPSSLERIVMPPPALSHTAQPERDSVAGRGMQPGTDPRVAARHPQSRDPRQPVVGMSQAAAESHKRQDVTPNQDILFPPPSGTPGKFPTDSYIYRQESTASASTEGCLPLMPLTRPGNVPASPDESLYSFDADQRYIGEGINTEIRREARRYKKADIGAVAAPVQADDQEWPLDPNLICPYCKVVFRRGQIREYGYHVDECQP